MDPARDNEDALLCLHAEDDIRYPLNSHVIPIWGKPVVYDSRQRALDSLKPAEDSTDLQVLRLVLVADYDLLTKTPVYQKSGCAVPSGQTLPTSDADMPGVLRHVGRLAHRTCGA